MKCALFGYGRAGKIHYSNIKENTHLELKYILDDGFKIVDSNFEDMLGLFDAINAGEFLHDDWEIVECQD